MSLRLPCLVSAAVLFAATAAFGQSPFPPVGNQQPLGQPSPFPPISDQQRQQPLFVPLVGGQMQQQPPCMGDFMKLRGETEMRGKLIQAANQRKASPAEACNLITSYVEADRKMIDFVETNARSCGIPPNIPADMKKNHAGVQQLRTRVCEAAQAGPQGPNFSDEFGKRIKRDFKIWDEPPKCPVEGCIAISPAVENAATAVLPEDRT